MKLSLLLLFSLLLQPFTSSANELQAEKELVPGMKIERPLSASEKHVYTALLDNGMAILATILQENIDLVIDIYAPGGQHLKQLDSPNGMNGPEEIDFTANRSGQYKLIVQTLDSTAKAGSYQLEVESLLSLTENAKRIAKQELPTQTLYDLWEISLTDEKVIDRFLSQQANQHIIEPIPGNEKNSLVTYFCVPDSNTEYVMQSGGPDFLGLRFQQLGQTKLAFVTQVVPKDARFSYGYNFFNVQRAGPKGEIETREVLHTYDGTIVMPDAPTQDYLAVREGTPQGKVSATTIKSERLKEERKITVYTPPGYDKNATHHLVILFDGESYGARLGRRSRVPTPTILDNLTAENKIVPTVVVLVWSMGKRSKDLISKNFADFIAEELIPWTRSNYNIQAGANSVVLAGSSRGGYAASYIALNHADRIGNVLSQSGSYWIKGTKDENHWIYPKGTGKLIQAFKDSKRLPIKFYMEVGLYDAGASMLGTNRALRDILQVKGYEVDYREFNGGHSYVNWRGSLSDGLISLLGIK